MSAKRWLGVLLEVGFCIFIQLDVYLCIRRSRPRIVFVAVNRLDHLPLPPGTAGQRQHEPRAGPIRMKQQRHTAIRELLVTTSVLSQDELRKKLAKRGFTVTQATLS